ncbi:MAG: S41 family peptidase [Myxococcota bacterium]|nr:S41 family peptidase [Myxococcota bacterium]
MSFYKNPLVRAFVVVLATLGGGLALGQYTGGVVHAQKQAPYDGLDTFTRALTQIQVNYVEQRSTQELVEAAIAGMTDALDEQSAYYDPETYARLKERTEGESSGVGLSVETVEGGLLVTEVIQGGPADLAGVVEGDLLLEIDGEAIGAWTLERVARRIQGPRGSEVVLTVLRRDAELKVPVIRDQVHTAAVSGRLVPGGVGYIRLEHFQRRSGQELLAEKARLEALNGGQLTGLVLDLRSNPGGLLEEAVTVVDHFVDQGLIVETRGRLDAATNEQHHATAPDTDLQTPVVVLMNSMSASASEIVAGSLQVAGRAQVVGEPSYGKGSVQSYYEYPSGGALKLTIARYYLADGRHFERGSGVVPDHEVLLLDESAQDPRQSLLAGIQESSLSEAEKQELMGLAQSLPAPQRASLSPSFKGPILERIQSDPQLAKAMALLDGQ